MTKEEYEARLVDIGARMRAEMASRSKGGTHGSGYASKNIRVQVKENNQRLFVYNLDAPLTADKVAVEVQATYGCPSARIFEIRLY